MMTLSDNLLMKALNIERWAATEFMECIYKVEGEDTTLAWALFWFMAGTVSAICSDSLLDTIATSGRGIRESATVEKE